jgi:hypothetical protein
MPGTPNNQTYPLSLTLGYTTSLIQCEGHTVHIRKAELPRYLLNKSDYRTLRDLHGRFTPCPEEIKPPRSQEIERYRTAILAHKERQSS